MTSKVPQVNSPSLVGCHIWKDKSPRNLFTPPQKLLEASQSPVTSVVTPRQPQPPPSLETLQQDASLVSFVVFLFYTCAKRPKPFASYWFGSKAVGENRGFSCRVRWHPNVPQTHTHGEDVKAIPVKPI